MAREYTFPVAWIESGQKGFCWGDRLLV